MKIPRAAAWKRTDADGTVFDSIAEMRRWHTLKLLQRAGEISDLKRQVKFPIRMFDCNGLILGDLCFYTADHVYRDKVGGLVVEEVKGSPLAKDAGYRLRKKAFELAYRTKVMEVIIK